MPNGRLRVVLAAIVAIVTATACTDDVVTGPFFINYDLYSTRCPAEAGDVECYELITEIAGNNGTEIGQCRVYAQADDYATDLGEVARFDNITLRRGESPRFDVQVPAAPPAGFARWAVDCQPGPPG